MISSRLDYSFSLLFRVNKASVAKLQKVPEALCCIVYKLDKMSLLFIWGFYVAFNTVQVISRRVVGRAEETSIYSSLGFCTVNCRPTASNYQLSHLRP